MATLSKQSAETFSVMKYLLLRLIWLYQTLISPILGPSCRFYPSCSEYAQEAIGQHGPLFGSFLAVKRLSKCHPFCEGGVDHVPSPSNTSSKV